MTDTPPAVRPLPNLGLLILIAASLLGFIVSIFNYFWAGNGIHGTAGALLVVVSSLLMLLASLALLFRWLPPYWLRVVVEVLIVLDIIGTGAAGWFLETPVLLGLMVLAAIGWLVQPLGARRPVAREVTP